MYTPPRGTPESYVPKKKNRVPGEKFWNARSRPCTIDGATIYPSLRALIDVLGSGHEGSKHPNFRYINEVQVKNRR
jgi:hypothetical protein